MMCFYRLFNKKKEGAKVFTNTKISEEMKLKKRELEKLEISLQTMKRTLEKAKKDLDGNTVEHVIRLFKSGVITKAQMDEFIMAIEGLNMIISMHPSTIKQLEMKKKQLQEEIETKK